MGDAVDQRGERAGREAGSGQDRGGVLKLGGARRAGEEDGNATAGGAGEVVRELGVGEDLEHAAGDRCSDAGSVGELSPNG